MSIKSMTMVHEGRLFRYGGGSFIAVWNKAPIVGASFPVPDDMIALPASLNKARATADDLKRLILAYVPLALEPNWQEIEARFLPHAFLNEGITHIRRNNERQRILEVTARHSTVKIELTKMILVTTEGEETPWLIGVRTAVAVDVPR